MISFSAVLQGLFSTAIGRAVPVVYQRIVRRSKIESTLKGAVVVNAAVQAAMTDFEIVIGSRYGELTQKLDKFLRALESSGIVVGLAEEAVTTNDETRIWPAFLALHDQIIGAGEGDAKALYDKIKLSFKVSLEALMLDPALAILIQSVARRIEERLEKLDQKASGGNSDKVVFEANFDYAVVIQKISKNLNIRFRDIRIETNKGAKPVIMDKIYIPSRLRPRREPVLMKEILAVDKSARRPRDRAVEMAEADSGVSYQEFRGGFRRAVVLGDPGGGKSTLCQYLCFHLAKQQLLVLQNPQRSATDFQAQLTKLPLRVILRSFESARLKQPQLTIFEFIVNDLKSIPTVSAAAIEGALLVALECGQAVIAFDGLDEILNTGARREFVELVTSFCDQFPLCPVLITSREVGYEDAPLPDDYEEFVLEKFNREEINLYVTKFLKVFGDAKDDDAAKQAKEFIAQTERDASDLRQNPLMLGLMTFLFASKGDVPTNRPEIYQECSMLMFEKWDQRRNIAADIPSDFDMLQLFGEIASKIYGAAELEDGVDKKWLTKSTEHFFLRLYEDRAKAFGASKKVTAFITGRSWVMSEFGPEKFRFTHRTFMEYFFARNFEAEKELVADLIDSMLPYIMNRQWDVISHLALQMKTFRHARRTGQAVTCLRETCAVTERSVPAQLAVVQFFVAALRYLVPTEMECKAASEDIISLALSFANSNEQAQAASILTSLANGAVDRRAYIRKVITTSIVSHLKLRRSKPDQNFAFCSMLASASMSSPFQRSSPEPLPSTVASEIRLQVKSEVKALSRSSAFAAMLFWEWYREDFPALFSIHKFSIFTSDLRPWSHSERVGVVSQVFSLLDGLVGIFSRRTRPSKEGVVLVFDAIGSASDAELSAGIKSQRVSVGFIFPIDFWLRAVIVLKSDPKALRGLLMMYTMYDPTLRARDSKEAGGEILAPRRSDRETKEFRSKVRAIIDAFSVKEQAMFEFWFGGL